ncbi:hypothetical protein PHYC_01178 [Phycisphaerales bacterium]|nr:hypothetical protein PHYC_01178 [Phycisphaerales bacterium]
MLPRTPRDVHAIRTGALWLVRAIGLSLLGLGAYFTLNRILFSLGSGMGFTQMLQTWNGVGEDHSLYRGLAMLVIGGALAGFSAALARWVVPMVAYSCPGCGYEPAKVNEHGRCPECGLQNAFDTPRDQTP